MSILSTFNDIRCFIYMKLVYNKMEQRDYLGNPHSTSSKASLEAINKFTRLEINYANPNMREIHVALASDSKCASLLIIHAYMALMIEGPNMARDALSYLNRIERTNERERLWEASFRALLAPGHTARFHAKEAMCNSMIPLLERYPRDMLALKLAVTLSCLLYTSPSPRDS